MNFRVEVDGEALRQVLQALNGPGHHIRELQATRDKPPLFTGNPIDTLIMEYNVAVEAQGKETQGHDEPLCPAVAVAKERIAALAAKWEAK